MTFKWCSVEAAESCILLCVHSLVGMGSCLHNQLTINCIHGNFATVICHYHGKCQMKQSLEATNKLIKNVPCHLQKSQYFWNYLIQSKLKYTRRIIHISRLFWYQICRNWIKTKRVLITRTKVGTFWQIAKSAIQLYTIVLTQHEICTVEWLILQSLKMYLLCSGNQNSLIFYLIFTNLVSKLAGDVSDPPDVF